MAEEEIKTPETETPEPEKVEVSKPTPKPKAAPKEDAPKAEAAPTAEDKPAPTGERRPRGDIRRKRREFTPRQEEQKEFEERTVSIRSVAKTVKGGRRKKWTALVVVGNHKGTYGYGLGKAAEVPDAIKKATDIAKKNLHTIPIVKGNTIPHEVMGHFGASKVYLKPAPAGTGVVAGGVVRAVMELSGVQNVCSKVYGSKTPINVVKATDEGLSRLVSRKVMNERRAKPKEEVESNEAK